MLSFINFIILTEERAKDVITSYPHLQGVDQKYLSSYGSHLGKITNPDQHTPEQINNTIGYFHNNKNSLPAEKRDISQYNSLEDIHKATEPLRQKEHATKDIDTLYDDGKTQVKEVKTPEACIANYGGGKTRWCVAASGEYNPETGEGNQFDIYKNKDYNETGKQNRMFTMHHNGNLYTYHEGEDRFADSGNNTVRGRDLPPEVQNALAKVKDPSVMRANVIARNPAFIPNEKEFSTLATHPDPAVSREVIKQHIDKYPEYFDKLRLDQHPDEFLRRSLSLNPLYAKRFSNQ